ncbi:chaperone protein ClpB1-like protein [Trifolium pratense]|uniref:Chaperone protein ClpB1-like protein n=1 Tax=Trifolium pratense TaxID=57577 RepID=A0A2K3P4S4_TRIPR|nr:chaperone protein ClpB1-like protein [Trifolium pratense]
MRLRICSTQLQALTQEAATFVKQAVNLATRRSHSQVTPLHLATVMLSNSTTLLHKACLQCHSHPLHYKALEICFNVSLNRLPSSTISSPLLGGPQYSSPSLSNSLVAAFKRAQGHQRRTTSIENQQQSILALKIEVEQLIISILDDPCISRVMREAGFSSTLIKNKVEQALISHSEENTYTQQVRGNNVSSSTSFDLLGGSIDHNDVTSVFSELVNKRRNTIIVGESLENVEEVAKGVMQKFERRNVDQGELRYMQFVSVPLVSFKNISKEEVERKIVELRRMIRSYEGRRFILYLGDLKWLFEFWSNYCEQRTRSYYCSVEHMVMEIKKLISGNEVNGKFVLMGIATYTSYMKCKMWHPSLEAIWELHPFITTCVGSLSLTLSLDSNFQAQERSKMKIKDESFEDGVKVSKHPVLPTWLQNCKEVRVQTMENQKNAKQCDKECEGNLIMFIPQNVSKQDLVSNPNSSPNSASSSDEVDGFKSTQMFNELNDENMKILCDAMEKKVPNQIKIAKEIASTVLLCRSGMRKGGEKDNFLVKKDGKQETWMLFLGVDSQAKELISKELAKVVFGSYSNFVTVGMSSFFAEGSDESKKKRKRDEFGSSYMQRFGEAMNENPHRVFYMEDFEQVDYFTQKGIRKAIESGSIILPCGESIPLKDAIVIFSSETAFSYDENIGKENVDNLEEQKPCLSLDLNMAIEVDARNAHITEEFRILELVDKQIKFETQEL